MIIAIAAQIAEPAAVHCPRMTLPVAIDGRVWTALEASDFYRSLPPARATQLHVVRDTATEHMTSDTVGEAGNGCVRHVALSVTTDSVQAGAGANAAATVRTHFDKYAIAGDIIVLAAFQDGELMAKVTDLDITGHLFPLAEGNSVHIHMRTKTRGGRWEADTTCTVGRLGLGYADRLSARLTGRFTPVTCDTVAKHGSEGMQDHHELAWLDDEGLFADELGERMPGGYVQIPEPGSRDMKAVLWGNPPARWTTYDWSIGAR